MRILIYSETEAAKARAEDLRTEGHHASLRNPQYFNPTQFDKACDGIIADDQVILDAYKGAGIKTAQLTEEPEPESEPDSPTDETKGEDAPPSTEKTGEAETEQEPLRDLESLTTAQLRALAADKGVELKSGLTKAAIIEALQRNSETQ